MDPFTERILHRAEQRSKQLGITNTSKFPLVESNQDTSSVSTGSASFEKSSKWSQPKTPSASPTKRSSSGASNTVVKKYISRSDSKENLDVELEINVKTLPNISVQVAVSEHDVDEHGNITKTHELETESDSGSIIRDSSRNRLQRLGALYSESENLSSPIHRTEGRFHEELDSNNQSSRPKNRLGKLAALADSINNWENDTSHVDIKHQKVETASPKKTGATPKKYAAPKPPPKSSEPIVKGAIKKSDSGNKGQSTKQLSWDKSIMDNLESQGFQRASNNKLTFQYRENENRERENTENEDFVRKPSIKKTKAPEAPIAVATKKIVSSNSSHASPKKTEVSKGLVSGRAAMFENAPSASTTVSVRNGKDPAEMSLKERMALFEKNKGTALIPRAPLAMSVSAKQIAADKKDISSVTTAASSSHKPVTPQNSTGAISKGTTYNQPVFAETKASGMGIKSTVAALMANGTTISESQISEDVRKQRQREMDLLMNRFHQKVEEPSAPPLTPPPAPPMPPKDFKSPAGSWKKQQHVEAQCIVSNNNKRRSDGEDSPEVRSTLEEVKRVKVNPPRDGNLYPTLSDLESTVSDQECTTATVSASEDGTDKRQFRHQSYEEEDSYMESDEADSSSENLDGTISRAIMNTVKQQDASRSQQHISEYLNSSTEDSNANSDMDEYLDQALDDSTESNKQTPRKGSVSSNSFSYARSSTKQVKYQTIDEHQESKSNYRTPVKSQITVAPTDEVVTLVHTVSFYRKQQSEKNADILSPRKPFRLGSTDGKETNYTSTEDKSENNLTKSSSNAKENEYAVGEKVNKLVDDVKIQNQYIAQASQALNLCASTIEFSGSAESVEAERQLLIATHRRQAALNEVQRLKVEKSLRPEGAPTDRGSLTVSNITIPLRQDYLRKLASNTISGHHLLCLLKYNETVLATKTVLTGRKQIETMSIKFDEVLHIKNVYADFKIVLEIYGMTAQPELLPHEVKYHIASKKTTNKLLTPRGKKGAESRLVMPPVQSPAGPDIVRTPGLTHYGFVIFSLREIDRTSWSLNQVSGVSPLEGSVNMRVKCELSISINYRGFLTMFEDVSGFGAWHRRWCRLNGHLLSYWKYPDDEKKKPPIGSIDLYACCSEKVTVAPRDVCARLNTLLLELRRLSQEDDEESLVLVKKGKYTIVRHLLSADTKEDRDEWSSNLNKALCQLRTWGPSQ